MRRGIFVLVGLVLVLRVIPAWQQIVADERSRASEVETALAMTRLAVESAASLDIVGRAIADSLSLAERVTFGGSGVAGGTTDFADSIRVAVDDAAVKVGRLDVVVDSSGLRRGSKRPAYRLLRLRTDFFSDIEGLSRLFESLESSTPLLNVASVNISATDVFGAPGRPEQLRAEVVLRALARPAATGAMRK